MRARPHRPPVATTRRPRVLRPEPPAVPASSAALATRQPTLRRSRLLRPDQRPGPRARLEPGSGAAETPTGGASRLRYLDSLRGTLMLLGIVLHTCARFGDRREALAGGWEGWSYLGTFIHLWRMPAFFLIAGFFATMVLSRRDVWSWWSRRVVRLGLPLCFGLLIVNSFLWPAKAYSREELGGVSFEAVWDDYVVPHVGQVAHLWFLVHLLVYCSGLAALTFLMRRWRRRPHLRGAAARLIARPYVVLALISLVVLGGAAALAARARVPTGIGGLRVESGFVPYASCFVVGTLLGLAPRSLAKLVDWLVWPALVCALALPALVMGPDPVVTPRSYAQAVAIVGTGFAWTMLLLWLFKRYGDRGGWPTRYVIDASLPVYLVHLPVIFLVAGFVDAPGVGPVAAGLITIGVTAVISFAIYELLNLTPPTRWLSTGRGERGTSVRDLVPRAALPEVGWLGWCSASRSSGAGCLSTYGTGRVLRGVLSVEKLGCGGVLLDVRHGWVRPRLVLSVEKLGCGGWVWGAS